MLLRLHVCQPLFDHYLTVIRASSSETLGLEEPANGSLVSCLRQPQVVQSGWCDLIHDCIDMCPGAVQMWKIRVAGIKNKGKIGAGKKYRV